MSQHGLQSICSPCHNQDVQIDWPKRFGDGRPERVRQRRRYEPWRVSHPFDSRVAVRLICWFPRKTDAVVVALFAGDKARLGDVWYNSVAAQADPLIDAWKREVDYDDADK